MIAHQFHEERQNYTRHPRAIDEVIHLAVSSMIPRFTCRVTFRSDCADEALFAAMDVQIIIYLKLSGLMAGHFIDFYRTRAEYRRFVTESPSPKPLAHRRSELARRDGRRLR